MTTKRKNYYEPQKIIKEVEETVQELDEKIDYLTFVPDGEPTLDKDLGKEIEALQELNHETAVITNSSLINKEEVQEDLLKADWISIKIDAKTTRTWKKINRPHKDLDHDKILKGIQEFSKRFKGDLNTETMLVKDVNDNKKELKKISEFIKTIDPKKAYISIPTRPPAKETVNQPTETKINQAYQIFKQKNLDPEYLIGYEGNQFSATGNLKEDILNITSVHPMREDAVKKLIKKDNSNWKTIEELIKNNKIKKTTHKNKNYYLRKTKDTK